MVSVLVLGALQAGASASGSWTLRTTDGPSPRGAHAMVYDSCRGVVVLYGGAAGSTLFGDTWEWDGYHWTNVTPAGASPPALVSHSMAFDEQRCVTVLLGGSDVVGAYHNETWEWDGITWTQRFPALSPPARTGGAMVYDSTRHVVVLFGGYHPGMLNDLWYWDGETWQEVPTTSPKPSPRTGVAMAYDPVRDRTVVFGGSVIPVPCAPDNIDGETWALDMSTSPATWTLVCDANSGCPAPSARVCPCMVYDAARSVMVLFGGTDYCSTVYGDTWEWDADTAAWTQVPASGPSARYRHAMAYDPAHEQVVLFGGLLSYPESDPVVGDTWVFRVQQEGQCQGWWNRDLVPNMAQPRNMVCSAVVDGKMYVFGGHNHNVPDLAPNNRVEAYDPTENTWSLRADMPTGRGMAACAVVDGLVYVIGGNNCESNCWLTTNEVYDPQTNTWETRASMPTRRGLLTATAVDGKIYAIGGADSYAEPGMLDDVEVYDPDPATDTWTALPPIPYGNRGHHAAVEIDGEIYLIGGLHWIGYGVQGVVGHVDVYNPATGHWRQVAPLPTPRFLLSPVLLNGRVYAIGGGTNAYGGRCSTIVEEYDPVLDCWHGVTRLPVSTGWGTAGVLGGKVYLVCGMIDVNGSAVITDEVIVGYPTRLIGDINGDGVVDFGDINPFVAILTR